MKSKEIDDGTDSFLFCLKIEWYEESNKKLNGRTNRDHKRLEDDAFWSQW